MNDAVPSGFRPVVHPTPDFLAALGTLFARDLVEGDGVVYGLRLRSGSENRRGVVHGGVLVALIDDLLGYTVRQLLGDKPCATISLSCDFLAAAKPGVWLEAHCLRTRAMTRLMFMRGELRADDVTVLTASGIWKPL